MTVWDDAKEIAARMVADGEAEPISPDLWHYAQSVSAYGGPPEPMVTPSAAGRIHVEWHRDGLDVELRFGPVISDGYALVDDARGVIPAVRGNGMHTSPVQAALRELAVRANAGKKAHV